MLLTSKEDIEAPLDMVFRQVLDFEAIERQVMRRGAQVRRVTDLPGPAAGMAWAASFRFRGKPRNVDVTLEEFSAPERMVFHAVSGGLHSRTVVELVALSRSRTRISMETELSPQTLSARLLVQSLKLAKGGLEKRFRKGMSDFATNLEERLKRAA